ncbi:MAG: basic amino acid ABC transporter substrate-binding protein [Victivallales bacterium]|nr:basic amino acid ABC transporter substrate-binding protein [Victivallales bacterium]
MVTNAEFPPFEFKAVDGSFQGIDIEIMQHICKANGQELVIEDISFDSIIPAINSGKADCGIAGMAITEDRKQNVDFTIPYYDASLVIVVTTGSAIQGAGDLKGKRIGVQLGTTGDVFVSEIKGVEMNRFNKGAEAILALTRNKVDAVVIDNNPAQAFVAKNADKLVVLEEPLTQESYAIAVKKGNRELLRQLNEQLQRMKKDGTLAAILEKYEP